MLCSKQTVLNLKMPPVLSYWCRNHILLTQIYVKEVQLIYYYKLTECSDGSWSFSAWLNYSFEIIKSKKSSISWCDQEADRNIDTRKWTIPGKQPLRNLQQLTSWDFLGRYSQGKWLGTIIPDKRIFVHAILKISMIPRCLKQRIPNGISDLT